MKVNNFTIKYDQDSASLVRIISSEPALTLSEKANNRLEGTTYKTETCMMLCSVAPLQCHPFYENSNAALIIQDIDYGRKAN